MLQVDSRQRARPVKIARYLQDRIDEAMNNGWSGEVEALKVSLVAAEAKLATMDRGSAARQAGRRIRAADTQAQVGHCDSAYRATTDSRAVNAAALINMAVENTNPLQRVQLLAAAQRQTAFALKNKFVGQFLRVKIGPWPADEAAAHYATGPRSGVDPAVTTALYRRRTP
jgi:hypothetical protein